MNKKTQKQTIRTFGSASFLNDMGSDMINPIWPLFVTEVLGAPMSVLGLIDGLGEAIVSVSKAVSGYLSDRIRKRKIFIWTGYLFGSVSRLGYAVSKTWPHLIPFRILDRAGKIRGAPRDAIIADISSWKSRGTNFGILEAMDNLGAVAGILICIFLFQYLGYTKLFLFAALPSFIGAILIITAIKEKKPKDTLYERMRLQELNPNLKLFMLLSGIFELGAFTYSFLLIYAKETGFTVTAIPVLYLIFTASASFFAIPFGKLEGKIGRKTVILIAYLLWALICFQFIFIQSGTSVIIGMMIYGAHKAALKPVQKTFVSELAIKKFRASALGTYQMIIGLCALPASLIAGILWDKINIAAPFCFSLGLTALALILLVFVKEK